MGLRLFVTRDTGSGATPNDPFRPNMAGAARWVGIRFPELNPVRWLVFADVATGPGVVEVDLTGTRDDVYAKAAARLDPVVVDRGVNWLRQQKLNPDVWA